MTRMATSTHPLFHPLASSQTVQNLFAELPLPTISPEQRLSPATFPTDLNHFSLSLLVSINPITCGERFPLQSTWSRSLPPPCPCTGLVSQPRGPSGWSGCPGVPPHSSSMKAFGQKKLDALGSGNVSLQIQGSGAEGTTLVGMRQKGPRAKKG